MTACKDSLNGKKAVSATLAGVLAVGMVPAAAFAATDAEQPEAGDIALLNTDPSASFNQGEVTFATDNVGNEVDATDTVTFKYDGAQHYVLPQTVKVTLPDGSTQLVNVADNTKYDVKYYARTSDGTEGSGASELTGDDALKNVGKYVAVVTAKSGTDYAGGVVRVAFDIVSQKLDGATLFEYAKDNGTDVSDTTFTYKGAAYAVAATKGNLGVSLNGKIVASDQVDVKFYPNNSYVDPATGDVYAKKGDNKVLTGAASETDAGTYLAVIKGTNGKDYAGEFVTKTFTIDKLDLSAVDFDDYAYAIDADDAPKETSGINVDYVKVDGETVAYAKKTIEGDGEATVENLLAVTCKTDGSFPAKGTYTFEVAAADASDANFVKDAKGSFTVSFAEKALDNDDVYYGKKTFADATGMEVNTKDGDKTFDASKVVVYTDYANKKALDSSKYAVKVYDADSNEVTEWTKPGIYTAKVKIDDADLKYTGEASMTFEVVKSQVSTDDIAFMYKGKVVNGITEIYDGTNVLESIQTYVKDADDEALVEGTDYTVEVKKGSEVVDEIVDAGDYTVTVKGLKDADNNDITSDNSIDVTIKKASITPELKGTFTKDGVTFLPYTGEEITPTFQYKVQEWNGTKYVDKTDDNDDVVYADVPADLYTLNYTYNEKTDGNYAAASEMKDKGFYQIFIVKADTDAAENYTINTTTLKTQVADKRVFADVPTGEWYNDAVYKISSDEYKKLMQGYYGSNLFGPNDDLSRAQTTKLLARLAGVVTSSEDGSETWNADQGTYTPFADVEQSAWYAAPIAWASKAGIVTGYQDGSGMFGPDQTITREQFCIMLQRYAEKYNMYEAADGSALAAMPDASNVSEWAEEAVAWAVEQGYIGKGGVVDPQGNITRAQAAQIMVRFMDANDLTVTVPAAGTTDKTE